MPRLNWTIFASNIAQAREQEEDFRAGGELPTDLSFED